jgi:hypothetical protein
MVIYLIIISYLEGFDSYGETRSGTNVERRKFRESGFVIVT